MILKSDLVSLKKYQPEDAVELHKAIDASVDLVYPWLPWCHPNYTLEETEGWLKTRPRRWDEGKEFGFGIRDRQNNLVGGCGLGISDRSWTGNLGYWLRTGFTGRGYATAATELIAEFGIKTLQLKRIEIVVSVENKQSQKVARRAGAYEEGVARNKLLIHDKLHDALIYSFIPDDF